MQHDLAAYIQNRIDALKGIKDEEQIAREVGYEKANIISMFRRGDAKVPIDKVLALSRGIDGDSAMMFRMVVEQYGPALEPLMDEIFERVVSAEEYQVISFLRSASPDGVVRLEVVQAAWNRAAEVGG